MVGEGQVLYPGSLASSRGWLAHTQRVVQILQTAVAAAVVWVVAALVLGQEQPVFASIAAVLSGRVYRRGRGPCPRRPASIL